jgi:uncharacterized membrane protein
MDTSHRRIKASPFFQAILIPIDRLISFYFKKVMGKILLRGFLAIAPIAITIALIFWIYEQFEATFGLLVKDLIGPAYYFKGCGIIIALALFFVTGLLLNNWLARRLYDWLEEKIKQIPFLKSIYTSVTDLMSFFQSGRDREKGKVVAVEIDGMRMIGIVTRDDFKDLPRGIGEDEDVAVLLPFSYQLGGFTVIVPRSKITPIDMTLEKGLRFCITAANPSQEKKVAPKKRSTNS